MELLVLVAAVAIPVFLIARVAGNRRREDPMAHAYGLPPWLLLGGLFFWSHGADTQPGADLNAPPADPGTWRITGGSDLSGGGSLGGGGDFGGGGGGDFGGGGGGSF